ncbi:MAG: hypothetical protein HN353_03400 [Bdellovibrionales bacterium]|jgi:hypothetical protein|nr:hypothetical protein [Bdellovibrionales bacterium]MBT3526070.1 hypothetical protein [Bdellovibrionales bacterium]MBT7669988.1 hypothetical protein [Bdellovibrionales bacterium]MBT7768079.1 hypothetical protein [Bdellovibrionales bacterium]
MNSSLEIIIAQELEQLAQSAVNDKGNPRELQLLLLKALLEEEGKVKAK